LGSSQLPLWPRASRAKVRDGQNGFTAIVQHSLPKLPRRHCRGRLRPPAGPRRAITISAMMLSSAVGIR
jgi:hypothetical protein